MAEQNENLPEGTDKVIAGASTTATTPTAPTAADDDALIVTEEVLVTVEPETGLDENGTTGTTGTGGSTGVLERVRSGQEKLSGQAADKARGLVAQGIERSAEALANVSRLVGDTATGLDERLGEEYGDYARRAAASIEGTANSLAAKDADELIDDTREFVRRSPGVALAGAAIVGFALARLIKSGLASGDDDGERGGRRKS